ncbi:hypothetical protein JJB07_16675 [Tumebacillus sp. ITR2]|uniref:Uncharacterized protein n=1 Tax=Tumebacillus amylolyticus TaxID=2801339 RepID=A0ABS1JDF9_9BACL|nr:hypothetical protein [Tumebacillus amylolyticus]MBL0388250.1 hypothetical protein [Tumebacillus amylolyticus]
MKKMIVGASVFVVLCGAFAGVLLMSNGETIQQKVENVFSPAASNFKFVNESQYPIVSGDASMMTFSSLQEVNDHSTLIAEVSIKDQSTKYLSENPPTVETWSEAEVKQVIKGDPSLKSITISETGGVIDMSKSKGNEARGGNLAQKSVPFIEDAVEGSTVMKKGNTYIVFLKPGAIPNSYTITGTVQGKIRMDDATDQSVVTVDPEHFSQNKDLFWLQRKFAGKSKNEILAETKANLK